MKVPTSEAAKRIAAVMHRRLTTPWSDVEIKQFRKLVAAGFFKTFDDLETIERFYAVNWPPHRDKNHLRHDLKTLLNNWPGEIDKASAWAERHPVRKVRKIIQMPRIERPLFEPTAEDIERTRAFMEAYKARKEKK